MERQMKLQEEAAEKLSGVMEESAEINFLGMLMLFGHRLINWAAARASEDPKMTALMVGLLHDAQSAAAGRIFDFPQMMGEFVGAVLPRLNEKTEEEIQRAETRKERLRIIHQRLKSKVIPLPLGLDRKFENGMTHEDVLPVFSHKQVLPTLMALFAQAYEKAGGRVVYLAGVDVESTDIPAAKTISPSRWKGKGDTIGQLTEVLKSSVNNMFNPTGLIIVEDADSLISEDAPEPRMARLVRSLAVLQQLQATYPMGVIMGVDMSEDNPAGMRPQESYPPYLTDRPHVWAEFKPSQLAGGTMNVQIDSDIYPVLQLSKMLSNLEE
jgi:hypothetical protein